MDLKQDSFTSHGPEILRGIDASFIWFEEAALLPDKEAFQELLLRLSGKKGSVRQLILTSNPEKLSGWLSDVFKLKQKPKADGTYDPIIDPCECHLCQHCLDKKLGRYEYIDDFGELCTKRGSVCPSCNTKKDSDCPGNQVWYRVIRTATHDNIHNPSDMTQSMLKGLDPKAAQIFVEGRLDVDMRESIVYRAFSEGNNLVKEDLEVDISKPLYWAMDFNFDPQCSVICQELEDEEGDFHVAVLDEIVLWNALPEHAAEQFCLRYEDYKESGLPVYIYGDPSGLYGTGDNLILSYYEKIRKVLIENGFQVKIMMKKPDKSIKDPKKREKVKIPVAERLESVNAMLCSAEDPPRVRLKLYVGKDSMKCRNLARSLAELQFTDDGKNINKQVDRNAGRSTNKDKSHLMTHPSDALGYYIYKRFPIMKHKKGIVFYQVPGESITEFRDGKATSRSMSDENLPEWVKEKRKKRAEKKEKRAKEREAKKNSLKGILGDVFGDNDLFGFSSGLF